MILFIGHDASLTGAPKSLLLIIEHFSKNYNESISIILNESGPLKEEYCNLGKVFIWKKKWYYEKNILKRLKNRLLNNNNRNQNIILKYFYKNKPKVIFNNTIVNGDILEKLSKLDAPCCNFTSGFVLPDSSLFSKSGKNGFKSNF